MSLILDALRRADSERERGAVPGLHAQPGPVASSEGAAPGRRWPWAWIVAAAGVGMVAALAWIMAAREAPRPAAAAVAAPPLLTAPAPVAPPAPAAVESRSMVPAAPTVAVMPPAPVAAASAPGAAAAPAPPARVPAPQPVAEPAPWPAQESGRKAPDAAIAVAPAGRSEAKAAQVAAGAPADASITTREQLPEGIRSQLPPLVVGGSIYSASAPDRSLIIDGRIYRENDRLSADLTLEQIRPKAAVLRFKGYRFEIGY